MPHHPNFSYRAFAAGAHAYGIAIASAAARTYGVPLETCLQYARLYGRIGYDLAHVGRIRSNQKPR